MKRSKLFTATAAVLMLSAVISACGGGRSTDSQTSEAAQSVSANPEQAQKPALGVSVYNTDDAEVRAFRSYFEGYLSPNFDVSFYYSDSILETEEELAFIDQLHEEGVQGLISFLSTDLDAVLERCDSYGMYYMRGSGSVSDEAFESAAAHDSFLGIIGPDEELERKAGADMADFFAAERGGEKTSYLLFAGGGSLGNAMHAIRTEGMLQQLQEVEGISLNAPIEETACTEEVTELSSEDGSVTVTILPGYLRDETLTALDEVLSERNYDVALGALALSPVIPALQRAESAAGTDMRIGMVDSFTEQNFEWFGSDDAFGGHVIDYVTGKYGATVGPAFAAMYNACTGEADFLRPDGRPFRLVQPFWTAADEQTYEELYDRSIDIYDNIYSVEDLRSVIREYTPEASYEDFKALTERDWLSDAEADGK